MSANKRKRLHRRGDYHGADSSRKKNIAEKEENGVAMTRDKYAKMRARKNPEARYGKREARGAADAAKGRTQHDRFSERAPEPREGWLALRRGFLCADGWLCSPSSRGRATDHLLRCE